MIEYGLSSSEPDQRRRRQAALTGLGRRDSREHFRPAPEPLCDQMPRREPSFELVHAEADSSFASARLSQDNSGNEASWHYHPELELSWVTRGRGMRCIGNSIEQFEEDDLVLIGPNLPHCYRLEDAAFRADPGPLERVVLHFSPDMFGQEFFELTETRVIGTLLRSSGYGWHVCGRSAEKVRSLMRNMLDKRALPRLINLLQILETLARAGEDLKPLAIHDYLVRNATRTNSHRVEAIRNYIRENLTEEVNQAHAARLVGLTPSAFSRFFRKATGHTFVHFVNELRISEACKMLAETDIGITEIAFGCGYWSIANFNRQFLRIKKMNPTQFREKRVRSFGGKAPRTLDAGAAL